MISIFNLLSTTPPFVPLHAGAPLPGLPLVSGPIELMYLLFVNLSLVKIYPLSDLCIIFGLGKEFLSTSQDSLSVFVSPRRS